jgi:hypothetical protein
MEKREIRQCLERQGGLMYLISLSYHTMQTVSVDFIETMTSMMDCQQE